MMVKQLPPINIKQRLQGDHLIELIHRLIDNESNGNKNYRDYLIELIIKDLKKEILRL